ncbi:MAG: phytanoyl-CoA dioxygenase family protein [Armatimonadetes bacterium]|nr:phytanoyl-CoA dioxygenase family protein [Armatimonadota bacterium]
MLPDLSSDYSLTPDQISNYRADGFILLRNVASSSELAPYRDVINEMTTEFAKNYAPLEQRDTYGKAFIQYSNQWEHSEDVKRFVFARRFAKIAAELMGVDGVRLYHDQALYKEPNGGPTPWHQDQQYWPLQGSKCVTLWMPLVDVSAEMGTMRFATGSQDIGYLGPLNISDESEQMLAGLIDERGFPVAFAGDMKAGDATFHDGWTIHGAPGNADPVRTREVMTIIYVEDGAIISEPDSESRVNDLARWFPDLMPGDVAASKLNPLVYKR